MKDGLRQIPIYFLVDTSDSIASEDFAAVTESLASIAEQMMTDPVALETASLSLITFDEAARQVVLPTQLVDFEIPMLDRGKGRALGGALRLCSECMSREVVRSTPDRRGDWEPICFLVIAGEPTDPWEEVAKELRFGGYETSGRRAVLVILACGPKANASSFRAVTDQIRVLEHSPTVDFAGLWKDVHDMFVSKITRSIK